MTGILELKVQLQIFYFVEALIPLTEWLFIDSTDIRVPLAEEVGNEVAANETTGAGY